MTKIFNFKFCHHQKKGRDYKNTLLCILYAVGQLYPKGKGCYKNDSKRKDLRMVPLQQEDVTAVDSLITDQWK